MCRLVTDSDNDRDFTEEDLDRTPVITCSRCEHEWDLRYELDEIQVGNRAVEQFALDHQRHTGHFPDDVTPWVADCRRCPDGERFLSEHPARRWARTHVRHTRHSVDVLHDAEEEQTATVESDAL